MERRGQTALPKAAGAKQQTVCCMLVAAGVSVMLSDSDNMTARQLAEKAGDTDLALYFESQSASLPLGTSPASIFVILKPPVVRAHRDLQGLKKSD